ncbi:MAG: hypothetical protein PHC51_06015 [bacterium]|nr:hypothetical protein [bacterium]
MNNNSAISTAYDGFNGEDPSASERELMLAILRSAVEDAGKHGLHGREALCYIMNEDEYYPFSFISICSYLNICPNKLRRRVARQMKTLRLVEPII